VLVGFPKWALGVTAEMLAMALLHIEAHGSGRPLVVLPSFSLDHAAMAKAVEPVFVGDCAWRRLYVDLPGTGRSPSGQPRSDAVLHAVVEAVGAELGNAPFPVMGWSYGGYLAAGLTRRLQPSQISGLMMVCSGFRIRPEDRDLTGALGSTAQPGWLAAVPVELHDHFAHAVGRQTPEAAERIAAALKCNGPTDEIYLSSLRTDGFALSDEEVAGRCDGPTCFLAGQRDRVIGFVSLLKALELYDRATFTSLSSAGHYLPLEEPAVFAAVARAWLDQCETFLIRRGS
jgi:pimeloyl-ACP methyl ester carboxylesterase